MWICEKGSHCVDSCDDCEHHIEVTYVRRGEWVWNKDHWECSVCRGPRFHDLMLGLDAAYCGRCGAKMR